MAFRKNTKPQSARRVRNSRIYRYALAQANRIAGDPEKLKQLAADVSGKVERHGGRSLVKLRDNLALFVRLIVATSKRRYRQVSWYNLTLIVASLIYFLIPTDLIPDFIAGLGYLDDATLLGWTYSAVKSEMDAFLLWEAEQKQTEEKDEPQPLEAQEPVGPENNGKC